MPSSRPLGAVRVVEALLVSMVWLLNFWVTDFIIIIIIVLSALSALSVSLVASVYVELPAFTNIR